MVGSACLRRLPRYGLLGEHDSSSLAGIVGLTFTHCCVVFCRQPFTITGLRAVSQAKPVNYTGSFAASGDDLLTRIWYTAVYTVRLNLEESYFGAILVDRGDRISWTGDAHVAQVRGHSGDEVHPKHDHHCVLQLPLCAGNVDGCL
jgi:hypothetical protein